ncbi:MAG: T9SS type A sorting domain-containing protein [bacterium]
MKKLIFTIFLSITFIHLMYAEDGPNVWSISLNNAGQIWTIAINPVSQQTMYAGSNTTGVWKTTNAGLNWAQANTGLTNLTVQTMAISNSNPQVLYCGTSQTGSGAGIYKSTDAGTSWTQINNGITETSLGVQSIAVDRSNPDIAYAAIFDGVIDAQQGVYKTTNGGTQWNVANTGFGTVKNVLTLIINPLNNNVLYCGTSFGVTSQMGPPHIYKSVNGASSWVDVSTGIPNLPTDNKPVRCLSIGTNASDTNLLLAGIFLNTDSLSGMYVTTNGGGQWVRRHNGLPNAVGTLTRSCLIRPGSNMEFFAGIGNATNSNIGIFRTTNAGLSWSSFSGGTMDNTITIRALNFKTFNQTLYAGCAHPTLATGQGVMEYTFTGTGIGNQNGNTPEQFSLKQNYPNPFNPRTIIGYELSHSSNVSLRVYDALGKEISTLVDLKQNAGIYEVVFDGSKLSSGVYFYRLSADGVVLGKSMTILK